MKSTNSIALTFLVALMALFQPCPAPFIIPVVVDAGVGAAAVVASAEMANELTRSSALAAATGRIRSNAVSSAGDCLLNAPSVKQYFDLAQISQDHVLVDGLPSSCMDSMTAWNAHPQIQQLQDQNSKITMLNATEVELDGLPDSTINALESLKPKLVSSGQA